MQFPAFSIEPGITSKGIQQRQQIVQVLTIKIIQIDNLLLVADQVMLLFSSTERQKGIKKIEVIF